MQRQIGFTVRFKDGKNIQVARRYHYTDWCIAKKELEQERQELIAKWEEYKQGMLS